MAKAEFAERDPQSDFTESIISETSKTTLTEANSALNEAFNVWLSGAYPQARNIDEVMKLMASSNELPEANS